MAIITGGIIEEWGPPKVALQVVIQEVRSFAPRSSDDEYAVDIAFRSWHANREPEFLGVEAGAVGRKQRRFIVWHSVPLGLETESAVRDWLADALLDTARIVREHLPQRSRAYPAQDLAREIDSLRERLLAAH